MEFLLVVFGALVGAASTGGVAAWEARRQRRDKRRVAARVILGDLHILEAAIKATLEDGDWAGRLDFETMGQTWLSVREAFASVEAWEWAIVDSLYSNVQRASRRVRPGEQLTPGDRKVLEFMLAKIPRADRIVLCYASTKKDRKKMMEQLKGD